MRQPIVGVMGSGSDEHLAKAEPLGAWLAQQDMHLLTGGGGGVMTAVARSFHGISRRRGLAIGILPGNADGAPKAGYPNPYIEIPIRTHLPLSGSAGETAASRNAINILTADVVVALPGSAGTASETRLALRYGKPLVAWLDSRGQIPGLAPEVEVVADFEAVCHFISRAITSFKGGLNVDS